MSFENLKVGNFTKQIWNIVADPCFCEETCEGKWLEDLHFGEIRNLIHKDECLRN